MPMALSIAPLRCGRPCSRLIQAEVVEVGAEHDICRCATRVAASQDADHVRALDSPHIVVPLDVQFLVEQPKAWAERLLVPSPRRSGERTRAPATTAPPLSARDSRGRAGSDAGWGLAIIADPFDVGLVGALGNPVPGDDRLDASA